MKHNDMKVQLLIVVLAGCVLSGIGGKTDFDIVAVEKPRIMEKAARYMNEAPRTLTADHCERSEGGIHDFYSEGDYWCRIQKIPTGRMSAVMGKPTRRTSSPTASR